MLRCEKRRSGGPCDVWCVRISASGALTHRCRICKRLKKAPTFWNTVSLYLPLWIQSCQKIATCLSCNIFKPAEVFAWRVDHLSFKASNHLWAIHCLLWGKATATDGKLRFGGDTMQMAFVPWFSRSMAVNSGKAFHTYDICQSALRLPRFERERERLKGHDASLSMLRCFEYVESLFRSEWPRWKTALPKLATASLVLFKSVSDPIGLYKQLNACKSAEFIYYILPLLHTECFIIYNAFTHYLDRDNWYNYIAYRCTVYCIVCVHCLLLMVLALRFSQITQISCEFWISRTVPTLTPKCSFQNHFPGFYLLHFLFCLGMFLGNTVDVTDSNLDPTFTGQTPEEAWRCMKGWGRQTFK